MLLSEKLKLYVITDRRLRDEIETVKLALEGGATSIQLRLKNVSTREMIDVGRKLKKITLEYNALFFVNDRVDIALGVDADGVHLGQEDMPPTVAREIAPNLIIGVSASSVKEAKEAEMNGADYIGAGSVFPTSTKKDAKTIGLNILEDIVKSVNIPVVAIGGINKDNVRKVLECGVAGVAVVSAIVGAHDVKNAAKVLRNIIDKYKNGT